MPSKWAKYDYDILPNPAPIKPVAAFDGVTASDEPPKRILKGSWFLALSILISAAVAISYFFSRGAARSLKATQESPCGHSVQDAISHGCTFDVLSDLWLPSDCDRKFTDEYVHFRNNTWRYWTDRQGKNEIFNRSSYINEGDHYWSRNDDHLVHCAFTIKRLAYSLETGVSFGRDNISSPFAHVSHCASMLLDFAMTGKDLDKIGTVTKARIGYCDKL